MIILIIHISAKKMGGHSTAHINDNLSDIEIIIIMKIPVQIFFLLLCALSLCPSSLMNVPRLVPTMSLCHLSLNFKLATLNLELLFSSASVPLCLCHFLSSSLSHFLTFTLSLSLFLTLSLCHSVTLPLVIKGIICRFTGILHGKKMLVLHWHDYTVIII